MQNIRIFISSPGDVSAERDLTKEVITELQKRYIGHATLLPVLWENLAIPTTASFQEGIDLVLSKGHRIDIAVFILWSRLGSPLGATITRGDGSQYPSGTAREFDLMLAAFEQSGGKSPLILTYTRRDDEGFNARLDATKHDDDGLEEILRQRKLVKQFIRENFKDGDGHNLRAYHAYKEPSEFAERLTGHLRSSIDQLIHPYDVFVSHASIDKNLADGLCAVLEQQQLRCWIAPRDILPGKSWGEAIIEGIVQSRTMVVIFSEASNNSNYVLREIERAVSRGIPIIPIRIEDVLPSPKLELYLSVPHWLDALTAPVENHFLRLSQTIKTILSGAEPTQTESRSTGSAQTGESTGKSIPRRVGGMVEGLLQGVSEMARDFGKSASLPQDTSIQPKDSETNAMAGSKNAQDEDQFLPVNKLKQILRKREVSLANWSQVCSLQPEPGLESLLVRGQAYLDDLEDSFKAEALNEVHRLAGLLQGVTDEIKIIKRDRDAAESVHARATSAQFEARTMGVDRFVPASWTTAESFITRAKQAYAVAKFTLAKEYWEEAEKELQAGLKSAYNPRREELQQFVQGIIEIIKNPETRDSNEARAKASELAHSSFLISENTPPLVAHAWMLLEDPSMDSLPEDVFWAAINPDNAKAQSRPVAKKLSRFLRAKWVTKAASFLWAAKQRSTQRLQEKEALGRRILRAFLCLFLLLPTMGPAIFMIGLVMFDKDASGRLGVSGFTSLAVLVGLAWAGIAAWWKKSAWAILVLSFVFLILPVAVGWGNVSVLLPWFGNHYAEEVVAPWLMTPIQVFVFAIPLMACMILAAMEHERQLSCWRFFSTPFVGKNPIWIKLLRRTFVYITAIWICITTVHIAVTTISASAPLASIERPLTEGSWEVIDSSTESKIPPENDGSWNFRFGEPFDVWDKEIAWSFSTDRRLKCGSTNKEKSSFTDEYFSILGSYKPQFYRWRVEAREEGKTVIVLEDVRHGDIIAAFDAEPPDLEGDNLTLTFEDEKKKIRFDLQKRARLKFGK